MTVRKTRFFTLIGLMCTALSILGISAANAAPVSTVSSVAPGSVDATTSGSAGPGMAALVVAASTACPKGALCVYREQNYQGAMIALTKCGKNNGLPMGWPTVGSWFNNQYNEAIATFWAKDTTKVWGRTPPAIYSQPRADWRPIGLVQAC